MDVFKIFVILVIITGCRTVKTVPMETVRVEREYVDRLRVDSVIVRDSVIIREKGDTVTMERWRDRWRERYVTDTMILEKRDTIPVPVPVEVVKYKIPSVMWWIIIVLAVMALPTIRNLTKLIK